MVWAMMKKRLAKRESRTKDQLQAYIRQFWSMDMTVELCNQFIDHIFKVLPIALDIGGQATGDLPRKVFPERSRHRSLKYFAERLHQPAFQAKIISIKQQ
jgi:hypothetical protein